ncbi:hypothetical protein ACWGID_39200 [Kribbella sp. NPDC054772]
MNQLIETPPDLRFSAMVESVAGSEEVTPEFLRDLTASTFRQDLGAALNAEPEAAGAAGHEAVNNTAREIDREIDSNAPAPEREVPAETARFANDSALLSGRPTAAAQGDRTTMTQTPARQADQREL